MSRERGTTAERAQSAIVGAVLREVRVDAGLSLREVEEQTDGQMRASVLSEYERGERMISTNRLLQLARIYQVDLGVLMTVIERRVRNPHLTGEAVVSPDE